MNIEYITGSENPPLLSILICTLEERKDIFLTRILSILRGQIEGRDAEIILLTDKGELPIGTKRNKALELSRGKYICFVDDDDIVSNGYVSLILDKISEDPDVIVFNGIVTTNGTGVKLARQGMEYQYGEIDNIYYRLPNHLAIHKKETILSKFMDVRTGEDDEWAQRRLKEIRTQARIDEIIYHYDFRTSTKKYFI